MKDKLSVLLELFLCFAKIGCFTFGGGYAMIGVITDQCVARKRWITHEEMMDITVIAESTPGPIAINCATYVGYRRAGFSGAVWATLGIVLPSFVIIYIISLFLDSFTALPIVAKTFRGIQVGVGILILDAGVTMLKKMPKKPQSRLFAVCGFGCALIASFLSVNLSSIALMLTCGLISMGLLFVREAANRKGGASA